MLTNVYDISENDIKPLKKKTSRTRIIFRSLEEGKSRNK